MTRAGIVPLALCGLCGSIVLYLVFNVDTFALIGAACFAVFLVTGTQFIRARERYLLFLSALAVLAALIVLPAPSSLLIEAAIRAAYLSAFFLLLTLLRDGAMTSSSVLQVGRFLTQQPPSRRYWALAVGGHTMGVVMNFGALILLAPLVQRGAKDETGIIPPQIVAIREQRQLSALIRGFSWFIAWAPTSIAQVVAVTVVTGASAVAVGLMGALAAAIVVIAGWAEDWTFGRKTRQRLGSVNTPAAVAPLPRAAFGRLGTVYAALVGLSVFLAWALQTQLVNGIILAAAPVTALWITLQLRAGRGDGRSLATRAKDLVNKTLPQSSPEATTLALGGFVGTVLAGVVPPEALGYVVSLFGEHTASLYIATTATVVLASMIAMPPMLTVTFLGVAISRAEGIALNPDLLALALVLGWAVNLTGSPFGGSNLILSRQTGISVTKLAFDWNARFSIIAFAICALVLLAFA